MDKKQCNGGEGNCIEGGIKKNDNRSTCNKIAKPMCKKKADCKKCLNFEKDGANCAWYVKDGLGRCIDEKRCDDRQFVKGGCTKGADKKIDNKSTCKAVKKRITDRGNPEVDDPNASCTLLSTSCGDCLKDGCFWSPEENTCVSDCKFAPQGDANCAGTTAPAPIEIVTIGMATATTRFDSEASMMCAKFDLEDSNRGLCGRAGTDCKSCVDTLLQTPLGVNYLIAPACTWFPDQRGSGGYCRNKQSYSFGSGTMTCKSPVLPPTDKEWPELLDKEYKEAETWLIETYGEGTLYIESIGPGQGYTRDLRDDRVRLFVDKSTGTQTIVRIPRIG